MTIYYINYQTVSGDRGQHGAWMTKPSKKSQHKYMQRLHPDEFEGNEATYISWTLESFEAVADIHVRN